MTLNDHIALCDNHLKSIKFRKFDQEDAWALGNRLYREAVKRGHALAIDITVNRICLFSALMPGATAENLDWVRRKRNMVDLLGISSWAAGLMLQSRQTTLMERYGLNPRDYAAFGGSYPLIMDGCGMIGTVTVSGAPQRDDHNLVISVLSSAAGLPENALTLVPEEQ